MAVRFLQRSDWELRLRKYHSEKLDGLTVLNTAEWWKTDWGFVFTVPVESDGRCAEYDVQEVIADIVASAPPHISFEAC